MRFRTGPAVELATVSVVQLALYAALVTAQRGLYDNGLAALPNEVGVRPRAESAAAELQTAAVVVLGVALCAVFLWVVHRAPRYARAGLHVWALAVPAVVAVALFALPPSLSSDAYSYLSHGYLAVSPGSNPYVDTSSSVGATAFGRELATLGWQAIHPQTPYGPLWTAIERGAYALSGRDVPLGVLLVKAPVLAAAIVTAVMIGRFAWRGGRARGLRACLVFAANPLVLVETAGEGHNDGLMVLFVVIAVLATLRGRAALAVIGLALAVLVKSSALPLALPIAVHLLASARPARRTVFGIAVGVTVSLAVSAVLIAPYWVGSATLDGVRSSGTTLSSWSIAGVLRKLAQLGAASVGGTAAAAMSVDQIVLLVLLVAGTATASLLARTERGFLRACVLVSLLVLLLLPIDWPWYALMPVAVLALTEEACSFIVVSALAVASRIIAPVGDALTVGALPYATLGFQALIGQTLPALGGLVLLAPAWLEDRLSSTRRVPR